MRLHTLVCLDRYKKSLFKLDRRGNQRNNPQSADGAQLAQG
eukprot:COSAG02_NODE_44989_length_361_cov_0.782443_1_plen_40_part_10